MPPKWQLEAQRKRETQEKQNNDTILLDLLQKGDAHELGGFFDSMLEYDANYTVRNYYAGAHGAGYDAPSEEFEASALHIVAGLGHARCLELLLQRGADATAKAIFKVDDDYDSDDDYARKGEAFGISWENGDLPVDVAKRNGRDDCARILEFQAPRSESQDVSSAALDADIARISAGVGPKRNPASPWRQHKHVERMFYRRKGDDSSMTQTPPEEGIRDSKEETKQVDVKWFEKKWASAKKWNYHGF